MCVPTTVYVLATHKCCCLLPDVLEFLPVSSLAERPKVRAGLGSCGSGCDQERATLPGDYTCLFRHGPAQWLAWRHCARRCRPACAGMSSEVYLIRQPTLCCHRVIRRASSDRVCRPSACACTCVQAYRYVCSMVLV